MIAELDRKENLAFGYANLNDDQMAEWGYISVEELIDNGASKDRSWKPVSFSDAQKIIKNYKRGFIRDKKVEGYLVDDGKIIGEARRYNPHTRFGEVMFYEIDVFGFISGYVNDKWNILSKMDIMNDKTLAKQLKRTEYENWKRHNIVELNERWDRYACKKYDDFESFCKRKYYKT